MYNIYTTLQEEFFQTVLSGGKTELLISRQAATLLDKIGFSLTLLHAVKSQANHSMILPSL